MIACLLLSSGTATCNQGGAVAGAGPMQSALTSGMETKEAAVTGTGTTQEREVGQQQSAQQASPSANPLYGYVHPDQSIAALPDPKKPLILGETNEIQLSVFDPELTELSGTQWAKSIDIEGVEPQSVGGEKTYPILHHADGSSYIAFVPLRLGHVTLYLFGRTIGGAVWRKDLTLEVHAPNRAPDELLISFITSGRLPVSLNKALDPSYFLPHIRYKDVTETIDLPASVVSFTLRTAGSAEVARIDPKTGLITPIQAGHVLVESSYMGLKNFTCLVVVNGPIFYAHSFCQDLLQPGESLTVPKSSIRNPPAPEPTGRE